MNEILGLDNRIRMFMIKDSLKSNYPKFNLGYETEMIMNCNSSFAVSFETFEVKKALSA